ncbi:MULTISPECIES: TonB-dependent siderophore receptor [Vibrio]|uniref:TonB-dependent siderophore receptor n=1 Tax=Vibrio TaxID=662 RepID=UPI001CF4EE74|nr:MULTISPECIES: TonB-dependent siderophore receptor [Vibrio]MDW2260378.1 TonB-dependent siderophore receptor [Vibrio sp. 1409]MCA6721758.1 TonB-dependent siderophore receptor [Vibrio alginolyticus]MCG6325853.1 TonB-dependent siderophore receptor [Vibrio alginolyticus]MCR9492593.1 TonB-dependent siderophore receptor [Vibrio alginolyticus]MDW1624335.1 TonB-dependent siderophore receptor [Vibrio sp. Vb2704]
MESPIRFHRSAVAIVVSALLAGHANATESVSQHETITVLGETYRNTATKTVLEPEETPQAITVITKDDMDLRGVNSVSEALRYAPGVNTELRGGAVSRLDLFNIRGFINYTNFYDGLPLLYNGWNLQPQVDSVALEQIEVFKGPTSVLYGNIPPGGMVNIIAKAPQSTPSHSVSISTGTNNLKELTFDTTGQVGDSNVDYRIVGLAKQRDGQADTSEDERYVLAPSFNWQATESTLVNVNVYYQNDPSAGIYTTVPASGSVIKNPLGSMSPSTYLGDEDWNTYEREVLMMGYKVQHDFNNNWQFLQNARYMTADAYQENTYNGALEADNRTVGRNAYLTDEKSKSFVIDNQLSGYVKTGNFEHNLLFGLDYQYLDSDVKYKDTLGYSLTQDIFNPDHNSIDRNALNFQYKQNLDIKTKQIGVYFQDQVRYDQLVMIAGLRWDKYDSNTDAVSDYLGTVSKSKEELDDTNVSFRVGGLYELDFGLSPYLTYSESFEPIAGADSSGKAFEPSTGHQWELGFKYAPLSGDISGSLALFHITKKNAILTDPNNPYAPNYQAGEVVSQGIELEAKWQATAQADFTLGYTYTDMEITEDSYYNQEGKTPVWVPEQTASLWANYFFEGNLSGLRTSAGVRYVGEAQIDAQNSQKVPDYTLFDLAASYDFSTVSESMKGASVTLSASNLFDKEYYSCYDKNNCWFGAERSIEAKLEYNF